jgi:hypothetical protein
VVAQDPFRQVLVHRQRRRQVAAARVRDPEHIENRLDGAVLAAAAVERQKDDVRLADDRQLPKARTEHPSLEFAQPLEGRRLPAHAVGQEGSLVLARHEAGREIHHVDRVTPLAQGVRDLESRGERHVALARGAAGQDRDSHRTPATCRSTSCRVTRSACASEGGARHGAEPPAVSRRKITG